MKTFLISIHCLALPINGAHVKTKSLHEMQFQGADETAAMKAAQTDENFLAAEKNILGTSPNFYGAVLFGVPVQRDTIQMCYEIKELNTQQNHTAKAGN
jgi:hypothetical protein